MQSERIYAEELTKHFDDFVAVMGVSFQVLAGEVLVLLGPNGAGKTTTVRMLTSILTPTSGRARVAGYDVVAQADQVRASVGVLTEQHGLYNRMNATEYLRFFGQLYGLHPRICQERITRLLEQFGLSFAGKKRLGEYSKGMRQKLALVRAMLHDPPVLLLDEPTSTMDPESARMVRDTIRGLRSAERAIILCTHNLAEAEELADQIAIIRQGQIILQGDVSTLKFTLLGPPEYEALLAKPFNGWQANLPDGVELSATGENWLRFQMTRPQQQNPVVLRRLLEHNLEVISFQEVPRSLEQVYIQAINRVDSSPPARAGQGEQNAG
ncbi:MAG TPA: ABC transporter ATP-binding protein [Anaerolineaceae bacterium]|nr:ABC transporter ATP-binding protein [Anaerolineaceae bacterium]